MKRKLLHLWFLLLLAVVMSACNLLDNVLMAAQNAFCAVSPRLPDHPVSEQMVAPVGAFPVWFVTIDTIEMSMLAPSLPPYNGGTVRKSLVVVSTELQGDLVITGHQLDGDGVVLFPVQIDEEIINAAGERTIIYSDDDLAEEMVIPNAQITTNGTSARGYAHHPWAAYYPAPGCYQLSGTYGGYTTNVIVEIWDE